ncbi:MAG: hypothetical protein O3B05_02215 [archaeon]|nr:hypothetical protein [archaeon]
MPAVQVSWDNDPVSLHAQEAEVLNRLFALLRERLDVRKRSIPMPDRERGGFIAFLYQPVDPRRLAELIGMLE